MAFQLWRALLLPAAPEAANAGTPVYAALRPLVGGPTFLPLHVQIRHEGVLFDFLPAEPTAAETTRTLLLAGAVEGNIRIRPTRARGPWRLIGHTTRDQSELREFAQQQDSLLSLPANNCWTFAANVARFALDS